MAKPNITAALALMNAKMAKNMGVATKDAPQQKGDQGGDSKSKLKISDNPSKVESNVDRGGESPSRTQKEIPVESPEKDASGIISKANQGPKTTLLEKKDTRDSQWRPGVRITFYGDTTTIGVLNEMKLHLLSQGIDASKSVIVSTALRLLKKDYKTRETVVELMGKDGRKGPGDSD